MILKCKLIAKPHRLKLKPSLAISLINLPLQNIILKMYLPMIHDRSKAHLYFCFAIPLRKIQKSLAPIYGKINEKALINERKLTQYFENFRMKTMFYLKLPEFTF